MNKIKLLSQATINRIAAGEVVERPSSVVKELVENSIDAGADEIKIEISNGGRNLIKISDNGCGISREDLELCIERHATSKLIEDENNLLHIYQLGFRGEALPSIGAVSRLSIASKTSEQEIGYKIKVWGGQKHEIEPIACSNGTIIEVRDIFFSTPARLKFLKSERIETNQIKDIIQKIAICYPKISFTLISEHKILLSYSKITKEDFYLHRLQQIFGDDFAQNVIALNYSDHNLTINGYIGLPTFNRGTSQFQYIFVNGRPIKDKIIFAILRAAYMDYIAHDRFPVAVLYLNLNVEDVDVNVHPNKTEVRFRDIDQLKSIISRIIKDTLNKNISNKVSTESSIQALNSFKIEDVNLKNSLVKPNFNEKIEPKFYSDSKFHTKAKFKQQEIIANYKMQSPDFSQDFSKQYLSLKPKNLDTQPDILVKENNDVIAKEYVQEDSFQEYPLGYAVAQIHNTYIIAQAKDGFILVDQHAAHERINYEKIKKNLLNNPIKTQRLLVPEILECGEDILHQINDFIPQIQKLGLKIEKFGNNSIVAKEIPVILVNINVKQLLQDAIDCILEYDDISTLEERILSKYATIACHGSIRAGRKMNIDEMNALLRQIENQDFSGQCNHGRPTYIKLDLKDIEKLFGRIE